MQHLTDNVRRHQARHHETGSARGIGRRGREVTAALGVLPHAFGSCVEAAHRESGLREILGQGGAEQAHADEGDRVAHGSRRYGRTRSANGPEMRTISLSWKTPLRITDTSRSPARPAVRVSGVSGTNASPRGAEPSEKRARLTRRPSAETKKISDACRSATKTPPTGPTASPCAIGPSRTRRRSPFGATRQSSPGPGCHGASALPSLAIQRWFASSTASTRGRVTRT